MRRPWSWVLAVATLLAWLPMLSVLLSAVLADWAGCHVDEGGGTPCLIGDADWGPFLTSLFVMGWLMLVTLPFMLASLVAWAIVLVRWFRQRRDAS